MNALHQFLDAVNNGALIDAQRPIFRRGLYDQRELDVMSMIQCALITGGEIRRANSVERKQLLRQTLILCKIKSLRTSPCVHPSQQIEIAGHLHLFGVVSGVGLYQVEEDIDLAAR